MTVNQSEVALASAKQKIAELEHRVRILETQAGTTVTWLDALRAKLGVSERGFPAIDRAIDALLRK